MKLYRPKDWNVVARRKQKELKKYDWSNKGGHIAPIFVPPTPNSELVTMLREVADKEAEAGINFKMIETGGMSMRRVLQVSNPMETKGCDESDCLPCKDGRGAIVEDVG